MPQATKADQVFGEIARKNKLLTKAQVEECLKALETERGAKSLADVVEKRGLLSARAVKSIVRAQTFRETRLDSKLYARIAVKSKFAEVKAVRHALEAQKKAYLTGEAPPDVGDLLVKQGAVTTDEDRAIRDTMKKLDREALVGKSAPAGEDGDDDGLDEAAAEAAQDDAKAKAPSGRAAKGRKGSGRTAAKEKDDAKGGAKSGGSGRRSGREKPAVMVDDEILKQSEPNDASDMAAAIDMEGLDERPLAIDTQTMAVDDVEREITAAGDHTAAAAMKVALGTDGGDGDDSSSISDSTSGRTEAPPIEELVADLAAVEPKPRPRAHETDDLMDVVMAPGDLAPLGEEPPATGTDVKPDGAPPAAKKRPESGEKGSVIEVAAGAGAPTECPRCNVRIEPHVMECLYCGYKVPGATPESKRAAAPAAEPAAPAKGSGRAAKSSGRAAKGERAARADAPADAPAPAAKAAEAAPAAKDGGDLAKALQGQLKDPQRLSGGVRFDVVRAKDMKRGGVPCVALVLPAGIEPTDEQVAAFQADAERVKGLDLKAVLHVERVAKAGGRTIVVYEDAEGTPATERVKAGTLDRMRASKATRELAAALSEAQKAGVAAREVRPEAILLGDADPITVRMAGFAAARLTEPPAQGGLAETGFDGYTPPERTKKADAANARTDLFGVGALLKLLLSGNAPTGREPKADLPDAPGGLKTVLVKTLDPASGKRFLDFGKLLEELEKAPGVKGTAADLKR